MQVLFGPRTQWLYCEYCEVGYGPPAGRPIVPLLVFLILGKPFLREHRFCAPPQLEQPPLERASLGTTHAFPAHHRASWEAAREPGEEG
jgi:hypothetical protein